MKYSLENKIKISNDIIGIGEPCYVIAEIGINHNGKVKLVKSDLTNILSINKTIKSIHLMKYTTL